MKLIFCNRLAETHESAIDLDKPHILLEKLDGYEITSLFSFPFPLLNLLRSSLVAPLLYKDEVQYATKAGVTNISTFIKDKFISSAEAQGIANDKHSMLSFLLSLSSCSSCLLIHTQE